MALFNSNDDFNFVDNPAGATQQSGRGDDFAEL